MTEIKSETEQLVIQIPTLNDFNNPVVDTDPKQVSQWLDDLPVLNLSRVLAQLIDAVEPMVVNPLDATLRMQLLELYRRSAISLYPSANKENLRTLPIDARQRKQAASDTGSLCNHLANGYKRIVADAYREGTQMLKRPLLLVATQRALEMLALAVLHAYRSYSNLPGFIWLEIHQLYGLAERQQAVDAAIPGAAKQVTIGYLYRRLMLLSIADPFHMAEGEAFQTYKQLGQVIHLCQIENRPAKEAGEYMIDLLGDSPPIPVNRCKSDTVIDAPRTLNITGLLQFASQHEYASLQQSSRPEDIPLRLFHPDAAKNRTRQDERQPANHRINLCFGVSELCKLLGDSDTKPDLHQWRILNTSASGIAIKSSHDIPLDLYVGDLAGIEQTDDPHNDGSPVQAAQIRWMRQDDNGHTEIGLEYLTGELQAVRCRLADDDPLNSRDYYGLHLETAAQSELILPKGAYRRGRILSMQLQGVLITIEAGFLKMDTLKFDQFSYKALAPL